MATSGASGAALALTTGGAIVLWAGLAGVSPLALLKTVAKGKNPPAPDIGSLIADLGNALLSGVTGGLLGGSSSGSGSSGTTQCNSGACQFTVGALRTACLQANGCGQGA